MFVTLTDEQMLVLLQSGRVGRLGCIANDGPYVTPINYEFHDGALYGHSLPGLKMAALRSDPRACLQVDRVEDDCSWQSVIAFGRFEEIEDHKERSEVLGRLLAKYPMLTPIESTIAQDAYPPDVIVFRINIERITGVAES